MKTLPPTQPDPAKPDARAGATLTEVLMAILIMAIGMIGVIALFPASVLRAVQAHALTTSTNLRLNAETQIALYPQILSNPQRADTNVSFNQSNSTFMVDPLGIVAHNLSDGSLVAGAGSIPRFSAGFVLPGPPTLTPLAENVFSSPDKWTTLYEDFPINGDFAIGSNPQTVIFSNLSQQAVYVGTQYAPARLVFFNKLGDRCEVRDIDPSLSVNVSAPNTPLGNTVGWNNPLPTPFSAASFLGADIGKVRVEQRDLTFTWLLTARRQNRTTAGAPYAYSIVVFHKRSFAPSDLDFFTNTAGTNAPLVFKQGTNKLEITNISVSPFLKRGGYVLDATSGNGDWYRIMDYEESAGVVKVTIDPPARVDGTIAVFMKGIVAVYQGDGQTVSTIPAGYDKSR